MKAKAKQEDKKPRCLVLAGFGLNSESELAHAFSLAGAQAQITHFSDISSGAARLSDFQILAIPGGWSFADDLGAGRIFANKLKSSFKDQFFEFASSGKPIIGICNGFQVLAKLGALPNISLSFSQEATLAANQKNRFEDRWVYLAPQKSACPYFEGIRILHCPVRHGEGRFMMRSEKEIEALEKNGLVVLKYCDERGNTDVGYPQNPNGSPHGIAGICDTGGKIFALMPHPEVAVRRECFPRFREGISHERCSLRFFENVVKAAKRHL
ncbi:MAG: phosphoribosylformylglycinamidine synthase subunit PurQ [Candidatus Micrarchaeota archaeon]|nr:phosphoribosylformylglycinamidine synthase subunit PurQ [Candidatus Micrarchaeota archaeon]